MKMKIKINLKLIKSSGIMKKNITLIALALCVADSSMAFAGSSHHPSKSSFSNNMKEVYEHMYVTGFAGVSMPKKFTGYA